jgi:hypothetical protein
MTKLTPEQRAEVRTALKDAIYHLCSCWYSLREAEEIFCDAKLVVEVETDQIQELAGDCCPAEDAYKIPDVDLDQLISGLMANK